MRKSILAAAAALALSSSAFAANDFVVGSANTGVTVSSGAFAVSGGNGGAVTTTNGHQSATAGFNGTSSASYFRREGHASISGVAATEGSAYSATRTWGRGLGGSGTIGKATAESGGLGGFDTHRRNPEGFVIGGATSFGKNAAGTISAGRGVAEYGNSTSNVSTYDALSWGNRDGGYFGQPTTDNVYTETGASSVSTSVGGGYSLGNATGAQFRKNFGAAGAAAHAESGNVHSNN